MRTGLIAEKLGMSRLLTEKGEHIPITLLKVDNCQVVSTKTSEKKWIFSRAAGCWSS